jgi:hypothetical protein
VSGVEGGGWQALPGGRDGQAAFRLPPVEPGCVVGLGAICDLRPLRADPRSQDLKVSEFVTRGLDVTADDLRELRELRYEVVLTDQLRQWLDAYRGEPPQPG